MILRVLKASINPKYFLDETNFKLPMLTLSLYDIPDLINVKTKLFPQTYDLYLLLCFYDVFYCPSNFTLSTVYTKFSISISSLHQNKYLKKFTL